jgi:predicted CopG family antitoxin
MGKSVRISEELYERISAHKRDDETMEETLRRLIGGPNPEEVAGILSDETADAIEDGLEREREADADVFREAIEDATERSRDRIAELRERARERARESE